VIETVEDLELIGKVRTLYDRARARRRARVETWQRNWRLLNNRSWGALREAWMPSPQASEIYPIVAALVGWMTDQRPTFRVAAVADPHSALANVYQQLARDLETVMHATWQTNGASAAVERVLFDAMVYGVGWFKVGWDASLAGGLGDVGLWRVDPFHFYPDPAAATMEEANYFVEARTMSLQELERRWPQARVPPPVESNSMVDRREDIYAPTGRVPMANPGGVFGAPPMWGPPGRDNRASVPVDDAGVTVLECWMKDNVRIDDDTVVPEWHVVVTAANQVLFQAAAKELWGHARHPYVRYVLQDFGEMYGVSLVEHLAPLQIALNRVLAAIQSNVELTGNPVFVDDTRSGITRTQITNRPGTRLTKNTGSEVGWLEPPPLSPHAFPLIQFLIGEMERVSGLSAIVRGVTPTGRNAQGVLDAVQESAFVRVRMALRNLERALSEVGQIWASLVVENYTQPRMIAALGDTPSAVVLGKRHFWVPGPGRNVPLSAQVRVEAGSTLPISRMARAQEADVLYAMGAIDRIALLEAHDYPNRNEIVQRITAAEAAGMFNPPAARQRAGRTT
jgi:hypothetical protein